MFKFRKDEIQSHSSFSRRDFARVAALTAAAGLVPQPVLAQSESAQPLAPQATPKLSPAAQAEAEAKIQNVIRKYGDRLTEEQRADVRKSILQGQEALEKMRGFALDNSDEPATALRVTTGEELANAL
jgi:hypothetical protein